MKKVIQKAMGSEFGSAGFYFVGVLLVLLLVYPSLTDYAGLLTQNQIVFLYIEMAGLITLLGSLLRLGIARRVSNSVLSPLLTGLLVFVLLCSFALFIGTSSREFRSALPFEFMHGHFFDNFLFLKFAFIAAPACGVLLAAIIVLKEKANQHLNDSGQPPARLSAEC